jgi:Protein of unknown function (DUF1588)/Protein of unknown function (DUF1587)/Protein of unknown function (DUF1585)/Protein of unknown function (DUF1592)/Protein of unknown function (DUF1595)
MLPQRRSWNSIHHGPSNRRRSGTIVRTTSVGLLVSGATLILACSTTCYGDTPGAQVFEEQIAPLLANYCYDCHGYGMSEGGVAFDEIADGQDAVSRRDLWFKALRLLRAKIMPPSDHERPPAEELARLETWIKTYVFESDPQNPDPGRVTVRRLNRVEYRNTIRDLLGVDYDTQQNFPPDDTGYGFDNIGDVLTISPLLLEKYIAAAKEIVHEAVPTTSKVVAEHRITGQEFRPEGAENVDGHERGPLWLSYYVPAWVSTEYAAEYAGNYEVVLDLQADETYVEGMFDYNRCRLLFKVDDKQVWSQEFSRQGGKQFQFRFDQNWQPGPHRLTFELEPLTPDLEKVRSLSLRIKRVTVRGPLDEAHWIEPADYRRFFPRDVPAGAKARREYARMLLGKFARRAYRRPVDRQTVDRLAALAEVIYSQPGHTFESGVAEAMAAVLVSPRFLFREESLEPADDGSFPLVDEYALASRLSYFLWSTMPDDELFRLAREHRLREKLDDQVDRMTADPKWQQFVEQFAGQWLRARDVENAAINAREVIRRDEKPDPDAARLRRRFRQLRRKDPEELTDAERAELREAFRAFNAQRERTRDVELDEELRHAMRRETEMLFEHLFCENRSLLELIDCDYTYLNERLARHYGIAGVKGKQMRLVSLPADSPRGGVLTQGTVLVTTSNPNRTSPVKRGVFILDNILGIPPAPPPPNIPPLEPEDQDEFADMPTLRETLAKHRNAPLCSSCHDRMDPLGLAMENFNALGLWRELDRGKPIDPSGTLISGESFQDMRELKRILATEHREDFYRCLTEKMLTFAIGRGLEYYDVQTVDAIVERLEASGGKARVLLTGIIESAPFQRSRQPGLAADGAPEDRVSQLQDH